MKIKRRVVALVVIVGIMIATMGMGSLVLAQKKVNVGVYTGMPDVQARTTNLAAQEDFKKRTGIEINWVESPFGDLKVKYLLDIKQGVGLYDVLHLWDAVFGLFYDKVVPLNEYIQRDFGISPEEFVKTMVPPVPEYAYKDGKVYFIPIFVNVQWGVYRKDLFNDPKEKEAFEKQYGYPLRPPQTYKELIDVSKFFTRLEEDLWGLSIPGKWDTGTCLYTDMLYKYGLEYLDQNNRILAYRPENRSKAIEVAQFLYDLIHKYKVVPKSAIASELAEAVELYTGGKAAMVYSWPGAFWGEIASPEVVKRIGPSGVWILPSKKYGAGGFLGTWGLSISKASRRPEEAWELIKWFTQDKFFLEEVKLHPWVIPFKRIMSEALEKGAYPEKEMVEAVKGASYLPDIPEFAQLRDINRTNYTAMLAGEISPEEFVAKTYEEWKEVLEKAGYEQ